MKYAPAGSPAAVDAALPVVCTWHSDATVTIDVTDTSMLRALAVAIHQGGHYRAFEEIGARPYDRFIDAKLLPLLRRDHAVANALTLTLTAGDAETLRDALVDAVAELDEAPSDFHQDAS